MLLPCQFRALLYSSLGDSLASAGCLSLVGMAASSAVVSSALIVANIAALCTSCGDTYTWLRLSALLDRTGIVVYVPVCSHNRHTIIVHVFILLKACTQRLSLCKDIIVVVTRYK